HSSLPHRVEGSADRRRLIVGDGAASLAFSSMSGDLSITHSRQATVASARAVVSDSASAAQPTAPSPDAGAARSQTEVLAALERGEIDVDEAMRRLGGE
ncbi:MAG TPA: hypothetical protein VJ839_04470, partial [Candidatus Limnocylindria bacterium]|nr:hypothetical protein [Candidatus Limnocylindria bacterium]